MSPSLTVRCHLQAVCCPLHCQPNHAGQQLPRAIHEKSRTDNAACIDWEMTVDTLDELNKASLTRREIIAKREGANGTNGHAESPALQRVKADE